MAKYFTDLNQVTGNAAVINSETRQVAATFRRIEHGDNAFYLAQDETYRLNKEARGCTCTEHQLYHVGCDCGAEA